MILIYNDGRELTVCDVCGYEDESDFTITMEYGGEDDCFGATGDEWELGEKYGRDVITDFLAQPVYHICHECSCGHNFMREFEDKARRSRVENITKMIEIAKLPNFEDTDRERETELKEITASLDKVLIELKSGALSDFGILNKCLLVAGLHHRRNCLESK
jgi:hypothetical protein